MTNGKQKKTVRISEARTEGGGELVGNSQIRYVPHEIVWNDNKTRRLWDFYSNSDAHRLTYFGESVGNHFVRVLKRKGLLKKPMQIVDFSCGSGAIISSLLNAVPRGTNVRGLDLSAESIERTNRRNLGRTGFAGAHQVESYPTLLENSSIDLIVLTEVIEHLDDATLAKVLSECRRALSKGGKLIITTPNDENLDANKVLCPECGCTFHRWQHRRSFTISGLEYYLINNGFEHVKASGITWGNELIEIAFSILRRKPTGILAMAEVAA